jgi:carnitine-CoA ligase
VTGDWRDRLDVVPERTLPRLLEKRATAGPDRAYLQFGPTPPLTFAETRFRATRVANGLRGLGTERGSRVAILLPNSLEFVLTWFGAALLGAIEVPVNFAYEGDLLAYTLTDCAADVCVVHESKLDALLDVASRVPELRHIVVVGEPRGDAGIPIHGFDILTDGADAPVSADVRHVDTLAILYTSGTTGPAKGVMLAHHGFYAWAQSIARSMGLTNDDVYYSCLPLYYGDAQFMTTYFGLIYGARVVFYERFSASRFWDQVRESGATATNFLGTIAHILWKQEPKDSDRDNPLRICNSIPMPPFRTQFGERFDVRMVTGYGQTETCLVATDSPHDWREGACGRASPGYRLSVVDESDEPVPPGTVGEIVVRSERPWALFQGYWRKPEATVQACRNLWFHSGDAGYLDEAGWLHFVERLKDSIRRRGQNISAYELECMVEEHEDVLEVAAVAVPAEMGEDEVKVVAVLRPERSLSAEALIAHCEAKMPKFMVPRYVEFREEMLPRTVSEKIAKRELREAWRSATTWDRETGSYLEVGEIARQEG